MVNRVASAAACAVLSVTACTGQPHEERGNAGGRAAPVELRCTEADAVEPPPDGQRLADGVVVARADAPQRSGRDDGLLYAKAGLWQQGQAAVRLAVVDPDTALAGWGKPGSPARELAVTPCPELGWRVWPGGSTSQSRRASACWWSSQRARRRQPSRSGPPAGDRCSSKHGTPQAGVSLPTWGSPTSSGAEVGILSRWS